MPFRVAPQRAAALKGGEGRLWYLACLEAAKICVRVESVRVVGILAAAAAVLNLCRREGVFQRMSLTRKMSSWG